MVVIFHFQFYREQFLELSLSYRLKLVLYLVMILRVLIFIDKQEIIPI